MNFCPRCGARLAGALSAEGFPRWHCGRCDAWHFDGPRVLVWCFAYWGEALVMCRRAEQPALGLWNPPSGYVENGESLEAAAVRELAEEAGVHVPISDLRLFRVVSLPHLNQVFVGYSARLWELPRLQPGPEASEVRLFTEAQMPLAELAHREGIAEEYPADIFRAIRTGDFGARSVIAPASGARRR